mmetsp:Transcript_13564/g.26948  ORF Transcript_13564/g.26948 Transcript_13564/m.26948 type:complete len:270 (-) Transcript_13564:34-843(-)
MSCSLPPSYILVASPGRSGTSFIADVFTSCPSCSCHHEPPPTLSGYHYSFTAHDQSVELSAKLRSMPRIKSGSTHVETNHTLLHSPLHHEELLKPLLALGSVAVLVVRRPHSEVVKSRVELGHGSQYTKAGERRFRGLSWIYLPSSPLALLPAIKPDEELSSVEVCCSYVLNVEASSRRLFELAASDPKLIVVEVEWSEVNKVSFWRGIFEQFGLRYSEEKLARIVKGGKRNERRQEKEAKHIEEREITYYEREIENYQRATWEAVTQR